MEKKNVLMLCPAPSGKGGVAYYCSLIKKKLRSDKIHLDYFYTGSGDESKSLAGKLLKGLRDLVRLTKVFPYYDLTVFNPSLNLHAILRDALFHTIAKRLFHKKTLIFFHGWNVDLEQKIEKYGKRLFHFFFKFDRALVLSPRFKEALERWGYDPHTVQVATTMCEIPQGNGKKNPFHLVFLSSLARAKGSLEAIQTLEILVKEYPQAKLYMVGEGEFAPQLQEYLRKHNLGDHVEFTGWLTGEEKYRLLGRCGIMLLPSYSEGMPISLLEGMAAGLAIVSRPVGGIPEIVAEAENGFLVASLDPAEFAARIRVLFQNKALWGTISAQNRKIARAKFDAARVVQDLENLYRQMTG